ncbi:MAG: hypothetical protein AAF938_20440 [Myxococcota bacterium]
MAVTTIAMLSIVVADISEATATSYAIATNRRDSLRAEYMARSGINLTRLLVAQEPAVRQLVTPMYQALIGRPPPLLPIWTFADDLLKPFCNYEAAQSLDTGFDFGNADGLGATDSMCELVSFAENSKININLPLNYSGDEARRSIAMQLFAMMGGYQADSPYNPLFEQLDRDGQHTSRIDIVGALVDWWDYDQDRTLFDPGRGEITASGSEDDFYSRLEDSYRAKNAPFDSLEEARLVRGVGDDFWATFVEPNPEDANARIITIYGSGAVNPNESPPEVLLARVCSFVSDQPLCANPAEAAKFVQLVGTVRSLIPVPFFSRVNDFLTFLEGRGGERDLYPMLQGFLGPDSPLLFVPLTLTADQRRELENLFVTGARILTINAVGRAGCREREDDNPEGECIGGWRGRVKIESVVNFHELWAPPPPNTGGVPGLGVFAYYRVE